MQFDTPYPYKRALLQSSPVQNCSVRKWPFQGLMVSCSWMEKRKNMAKPPWPLKKRAVKFKGQFSLNGVLNCSVFSLRTWSPVITLHPLWVHWFLIPVIPSPLGERREGFTRFCGTQPPLLWKQTMGWPSPRGAVAVQPSPQVPSQKLHHAWGLSEVHSSTRISRCFVAVPGFAWGSCGSVTDELDSLLSPGDWALARLWVQALSKSHS